MYSYICFNDKRYFFNQENRLFSGSWTRWMGLLGQSKILTFSSSSASSLAVYLSTIIYCLLYEAIIYISCHIILGRTILEGVEMLIFLKCS